MVNKDYFQLFLKKALVFWGQEAIYLWGKSS
jgi:hypothetical protein